MKKKVVISAINFTSGGPLSIFKDCLHELSKNYAKNFEIIALVNSKSLYNIPDIKYIEFPLSKKTWFLRLYYEYIYFYFLSIKLEPEFWISMHDITPNVKCKRRFVYCHNPTPFYNSSKKDIFSNPKTFLFSVFYKYLYKINIKKNKYVIVQQNWIKEAFTDFWQIKNILVAYPEVKTYDVDLIENTKCDGKNRSRDVFRFFYPSFPRPFKNFEIICEAYTLLPQTYQNKCEVNLTIEKGLNNYSKEVVDRYEHYQGINFLGLLSRAEVYKFYRNSDCFIFPSKLETWGLPITEYKATSKPMLLADKPYAKETIGSYNKVSFFNTENPEELKDLMISLIDNTIVFEGNKECEIKAPFVKGWSSLLDKILSDDD